MHVNLKGLYALRREQTKPRHPSVHKILDITQNSRPIYYYNVIVMKYATFATFSSTTYVRPVRRCQADYIKLCASFYYKLTAF